MILGKNVEQDHTTCRVQELYKNDNNAFLTFGIIFIWNILMVLGRNVEQDDDVSGTKMTTLPFLLLTLSSFV